MRPNVVLIITDQMRGDCLSHDGHPVIETPWLDHLAKEGVSFRRAYSAVPNCIAARAGLMTGLCPEHHGRTGYQDRLTWDYPVTLPREFQKGGYQTYCVGKMHVWPPRNRLGFDEVELHDGYLHTERSDAVPQEQHQSRNDDYLTWLRQQLPDADITDAGLECNSWLARPFPYEERLHPTNWVTQEALRFLKRRDPTVPFFLTLSYVRPHSPLDPPDYYFQMYNENPDLPMPYHADWETEDTDGSGSVVFASAGRVADKAIARARAAYYGCISHIDNQIGRLYMGLTDADVLQNTVILFVSDHGDMLGDFNLLRKSLPYEGSSRVPMILADPGRRLGLARGTRPEAVTELRDVMPTLLEAAGLPVPASIDGVSLLPVSRGEADSVRPYLHGEHTCGALSSHWIIEGPLKYCWFSGTGREQLFDLSADPTEIREFSRDPAYAEALLRLRAYLISDLAARGDEATDGTRLIAGKPQKSTQPHLLGKAVPGPAEYRAMTKHS